MTEEQCLEKIIGKDTIPIISLDEVEIKLQSIFIIHPPYPRICSLAEVEGKVVVKALVDTNGSILYAKISKCSGNKMLNEAALKAVKEARLPPAKYQGKPVRIWVSIPYEFSLTK